MAETMMGAILPGNSTVELREFPIPTPGHGQVLVKTMASTICGSDIRCIYREHTGKGAEGYIPGTIAGHEPCGQIVAEGPGLKRFKKGDRVIVYHISGCGVCHDCRMGYQISCTSEHRAAYGWQRDGGMAPYILADEKDLVFLPEPLTYADGAQVACGFGTVYEALEKIGCSGNDAVLVVGLGPVGLAALMLAKAKSAAGRGREPRAHRAGEEAGSGGRRVRSGRRAGKGARVHGRARRGKGARRQRQRTGPRACHPRHARMGQNRFCGRGRHGEV